MSQAMAHWTKDNQEGLESHEVAGVCAAGAEVVDIRLSLHGLSKRTHLAHGLPAPHAILAHVSSWYF